jgi:TatD DNase family protein
MPTIVDTHAHLDDASFADDLDSVLARAKAAGVERVVVPAIDFANWQSVADLEAAHPCIAAAYGLHPLFLARHRPEHLDALPAWLQTHASVAVGEIGLDFYVEGLDAQEQRRYFDGQLRVAMDMHLPVIVHARRAVEEVTLTLRRHAGLRGVVHSFSGSEEQARQLWELGFMLGIGGPITYERASRLRGIVARMPLEFLLLETDAPDQPLSGHRGARNEPARTAEVLATIAGLRGETPQAIAQATTANAAKLFVSPA